MRKYGSSHIRDVWNFEIVVELYLLFFGRENQNRNVPIKKEGIIPLISHIRDVLNLEIVVELYFFFGRENPNRKQSIHAQKSQQVISTMIFYQNSNAEKKKVNKVRRQFLSSTPLEYEMN